MLYIMFMLLGMIAGLLIATAIQLKDKVETESLIKASRKALARAENTIVKQLKKIINLENNLEFVTNNLSAQKKKYIGM